ncbi:MAG: autotransporter-associated beta strand repeat-containing protein, partial [Pseudomonadota bacterium]
MRALSSITSSLDKKHFVRRQLLGSVGLAALVFAAGPAVAQTVTVTSGQTLTTANATSAVTLSVAGASLTNAGTVSTTTTAAPAVRASIAATINNTGQILATGAAAIHSITGSGLLTVTNAAGAKISSTGYSLDLNSSTSIDNSGTIEGDWGIRLIGVGGTVTNRAGGIIQSTNAHNYGIYAIDTTGGVIVDNSGTIIGGDFGIWINSASRGNTITNNGTITGVTAISLVTTAAIADTVTLGAASITNGHIFLGGGNDTLTINAGATVTGNLDGSTGTDALILQGASGTGTITGTVLRFESITKSGASTFILSNAGPANATAIPATIAVNGGTLSLGGSISTNWTGATTIASGATLIYNLSGNSTIMSAITGAGNFTKSGVGALTLNASPAWTGITTVSGGVLIGTAAQFSALTGGLVNNGGIVLNTPSATTFNVAYTGSGRIGVMGQTVGNFMTFGSAYASGLIAGASGRILLTGTVTTNASTAAIDAIGEDAYLTNQGTVTHGGATGGRAVSSTGKLTVVNAVGASIINTDSAVPVSNTDFQSAGVYAGGYLSLENAGTITSKGTGVVLNRLASTGGVVNNLATGVIDSQYNGIYGYYTSTIDNYGIIRAAKTAVMVEDDITLYNRAGALIQGGTGYGIVTTYLGSVGNLIENAGTIRSGGETAAVRFITGVLKNLSTGQIISTTADAIYSQGDSLQIQNAGAITGDNNGITLYNGLATLNSSIITNASTGVITGTKKYGVLSFHATALTNAGMITGASHGLALYGGGTVTNSGTIKTTDAHLYGIASYDSTYVTSGLTVNNSGTIIGGDYAIYANSVKPSTIVNDGTITGNTAIGLVATTAVADTVTLGAASITNGNVFLGGGNDTLTINAGAALNGGIDSGTGTDALVLQGVSGTGTITGTVSNFETITKNGASSFVLANAGSLGAALIAVNEGSLSLNGASNSGWTGATTVASGATLTYNLSGSGTISAEISGAGNFTKNGAGTLILNTSAAWTGTTTISAGTLQVGDGTTTGMLGIGAVVNNATLAFKRSDSITVSNIISGTGSLIQAGTGTLILTASNSYGGTTINAGGTLQVGNNGAVGTLGNGALTNNGTLVFKRSDGITLSNA